MDYIYYKLPNGNVWNYWGVERDSMTEEGIAAKLAKKLGFNSDLKIRVSEIDWKEEPVSFSVGQLQIKRVAPSEISRFHAYFDDQLFNGYNSDEKDSYFQSYLDGKLGF